MRSLNFFKNYNNKLDCEYYTSIRPAAAGYMGGERLEVFKGEKKQHEATVVGIRQFTFDKLNDFITCLDAGVTLPHFKALFKGFYPDFDFENEAVVMLLLKRLQDSQAGLAANEKIALFCRSYEQQHRVKYKISKAEVGMISKAEMSEPLVQLYFTSTEWWAKVKSVTNYCKNINEIRQLAVNGSTGGHPNRWDVAHTKKLDGAGLTAYYQHLRGLGLKAVKDRNNSIVDWR